MMQIMEEIKTWRELLGEIISNSSEKQRIAQALKINPVTLSRWSSGHTRPRYDNIRLLLEAVPQQRKQLAELLADDFPQLFNEQVKPDTLLQEIPSAFYGRVLNAYTSSPAILRSSTICILILQQILTHIDPGQLGMAAIIIQCMPPTDPGKIRSLRKTYGRGTAPWVSHDYQTQFFGVESTVGQALISGHPITVQYNHEKTRIFAEQHSVQEESCAVYPIMQSDRTAGCLLVISSQVHYFNQVRIDLMKCYADLLTLAFEPEEFYNLSQIELGIMPNIQTQHSYLADFQQRVIRTMLQAAQNKQSFTRLQAELLVWQELEQELLHLSQTTP
jgi:transcriptional regulator with XRE-family HTH domain